jgi:hypothetical protein
VQYLRLAAEMVAEAPVRLPAYAGSTLHGGFKRATKQGACLSGNCDHCERPEACGYGLIFETPVPESAPGRFQNNDSVPSPVFLRPPQRTGWLSPGDRLSFECRLVGSVGLRQLDDVLMGLERMAERGLGRDRGALKLTTVEAPEHDARLYDGDGRGLSARSPAPSVLELDDPATADETDREVGAVTITTRTPIHATHRGEMLDAFDFGEFVYQAVDRFRVLGRCWGESPETIFQEGEWDLCMSMSRSPRSGGPKALHSRRLSGSVAVPAPW